MNFIKTPVKGMPEKSPNQMILREYVIRKIKDTYKTFGFMLIETPLIEHIENLTGKMGGENEQLIFKILKRGEKLKEATDINDMCDSGLRYDLTLPLARFYANNMDSLPVPFKALQIGESFRADRPQKGRFRQFTQCDIDILADETNLAEIELISATVNMLSVLNIKNIKVRINDRAILKAMAKSCNFPEEMLDMIYITLDKMDKIGLDGVKNALVELGLNNDDVEKYCKYFDGEKENTLCDQKLANSLKGFIGENVIDNLNEIISSTRQLIDEKTCKIVFDATLVRGMSYYTGPIFEIELEGYNLSVAGGGRYDNMIGKYISKNVCACGFSIGLERILSVISENNLIDIQSDGNIAYLVPKNCSNADKLEILKKANQQRKEGKIVTVVNKSNNTKFQKETLKKFGYSEFVE